MAYDHVITGFMLLLMCDFSSTHLRSTSMHAVSPVMAVKISPVCQSVYGVYDLLH